MTDKVVDSSGRFRPDDGQQVKMKWVVNIPVTITWRLLWCIVKSAAKRQPLVIQQIFDRNPFL